jgi:hypothetical protein
MQVLIMLATLSLLIEAVPFAFAYDQPQQVLPGCNYTCGGVKVPYPFGIGNSTAQNHTPCYMNSKFYLTCVNNSKLIRGNNVQVLDINPQGQMEMKFFVSHLCTNSSSNCCFSISKLLYFGFLNSIFYRSCYQVESRPGRSL